MCVVVSSAFPPPLGLTLRFLSLTCWAYRYKLRVVQQEVSLSSVTLERDPEQKKSLRNDTFETVSAHPTCALHVPLGPMVIFGLEL